MACFHQQTHVQRAGKKAETFIRALYELSEHCAFGVSREENIRDRIVVGIMKKDVSRKLQLMKDPALAVIIETVRQSEEVASQVSMQGEAMEAVNKVTHKYSKNFKQYGKQTRETNVNSNCRKCGKMRHNRGENCPALEFKCNSCNNVGHWSRVCRNGGAVSEVTEQQQSYLFGAVCKAADGSSEQRAVELMCTLFVRTRTTHSFPTDHLSLLPFHWIARYSGGLA